MWPSVPAFGGFRGVSCPDGASCELPHCIFGQHPLQLQSTQTFTTSDTTLLDEEPAAKRPKLQSAATQPTQQVDEESTQRSETQVFTGLIASKNASLVGAVNGKMNTSSEPPNLNGRPGDTLPRTATKPVSPPPPKKPDANTVSKAEVEVRLVPTPLVKEPALSPKRAIMLRALHKFMSSLNAQVARAVDQTVRALLLSSNQLNKLAVDEEEKIAKEHVAVYENVVKQRIAALNKMTVGGWVKERRDAAAKERGDAPKKALPIKVDTGLTPKEEVIFLSTLAASQATLDAHGIVTKLHTESELQAAQSALDSSDSWEACDRCGTRFQVFADRRLEDGALTAGGVCKHHWGKRVFPNRKASRGASSEPTRLSCCNGVVGSPGCVDHDTHVFKISDTRRMSLVMPYMETPENDQVEPHTAVSFDCEMGYTTLGLELIRLTVVSWPYHKVLVDVLVQPIGHVLDLNTRFSGVTPDGFLKAKSYDPGKSKPNRFDLRKVDSPHFARDLFLSHVSPTTYVIGHAIENDLNVIRLIHPTSFIIDTMVLYPHHQGLPYRNGLKALAKSHLNLDIQQGGAAGHDSYEDAKTTGELVRAKISSDWLRKKTEGWIITDDGVHPPLPAGLPMPPPLAPPAPPMIGMSTMAVLEGSQVEKRKLELVDGSDGAGDERPAKKRA